MNAKRGREDGLDVRQCTYSRVSGNPNAIKPLHEDLLASAHLQVGIGERR